MNQSKKIGIICIVIGLGLTIIPGAYQMVTGGGDGLIGFGYCMFNLEKFYNEFGNKQ